MTIRLAAAAGIAFSLLPLPVWASPKAMLSETRHDFGTVRQGEKVTHAFSLKNEGDEPLFLQVAGITVPGLTARLRPVIPPGQEAAIRIVWDTSKFDGPIAAAVNLRSNDPALPEIALAVRVNVRPSIALSPHGAVFLSVWRGESGSGSVRVINYEERSLTILKLRTEGQHFNASTKTIVPGKEFEVTVVASTDAAPGRYKGYVELLTNRPDHPPLRVVVNLIVKGEIHVEPETVDFGRISIEAVRRNPKLAGYLTQTMALNKRKGSLKILRIESDLGFLIPEFTPAGPSASFRLDLRLMPERLVPGPISGSVTITTDDATVQRLSIPVTGTLSLVEFGTDLRRVHPRTGKAPPAR